MRYVVRINKKVTNKHVYKIIKKTSGNVNLLTKLFIRIFSGEKKEKEEQIKL